MAANQNLKQDDSEDGYSNDDNDYNQESEDIELGAKELGNQHIQQVQMFAGEDGGE